jgi:hypothetical protein
MPSRGGRKRTALESQAFKSEIIKLRALDESIVKIAQKMNVSRQYVSLVLIEAGLGGKIKLPTKKRDAKMRDAKMRPMDNEIGADISRLEKQGDYSLANRLRVVADRRKCNQFPGKG